ncbi:M15 family metallopeptidase [Tardiphaga sp. 813_E8_N1_3]|uniref:M15 family metallopeptidase n=1 Tax=Tardiphaga sp. 813_E8_N1_3 TaxID=3240760 RepID=UPI003F212276
MVKVPSYEQNVQLRPEFRQDLVSSATPQAFGSDIGNGMEQLAKGGMDLAKGVGHILDLQDALRAKDADNDYANWMRERQYGPGGFMTLEGRAAVDGRVAFEREAAEKRKEFGRDLTPGAGLHYHQASQARLQATLNQSIQHTGQATKQWFNQASAARIETFGNDALANFDKPNVVMKNIAAGQAELRQAGAMHGWDADTLSAKEREYVSGVHKNITLQIATTDALAADKYMKANASSLSGADRYSLDTALSTEIKSELSKREADNILQNGRKVDAPTQTQGRTIGQSGPSSARALVSTRLTSGKAADHIDGLDESFATNLGAMIQDAPPGIREKLGVLSGYRSNDRQQQLWTEALQKYGSPEAARKWVAPPGSSKHNHGQAVDLAYDGQSLAQAPKEVVDWVHANAGKYGMFFPMAHEPWHVEPTGSRSGTVSPRNNMVAPRAAMASYDDIEGRLAAISDPKVRDLTRQRVMSGIEMQNKATEARQKQAQAELWQYIDQGKSPDQVPMETRQAAGMAAVSSAWGYMATAKTGREVQSDETLVYDMRRYAASNPTEFAKVDLNDYRDRLSKDTIKEFTGLQSGALTDQRKAREEGLNLTTAFSQAETQLASVGISTAGKKGAELEAANRRVAQFNNALSSQMDEFKRANKDRRPNQMEIQSMINALLLPVVVKTPGTAWAWTEATWDYLTGFKTGRRPDGNPSWGTNEWKPKISVPVNGFFSNEKVFEPARTFAFEAANRPDGSFVDAVVKYEDIPIDLRRTIARDLENEMGRQPGKGDVMQRYEKFLLHTQDAAKRR